VTRSEEHLGAHDAASATASATARSADGNHFEEFFARESTALVRLAVLLVDDRGVAEDIVQDVVTGMLRRWSDIEPSTALAYARTSVLNRSRSVLRRRRVSLHHRGQLILEQQDRFMPSAEAVVLMDEQRLQVMHAVRSLPTRQREVVVLRYWLALSEAEIAALLGVRPGTVKTAASRAMRTLARILGDDPA
jgi:RNA polymerase sigma-70 factor (sigma-E family)